MWDLSNLTREWTCTVSIGRQIFNHWTARGVQRLEIFFIIILKKSVGLLKKKSNSYSEAYQFSSVVSDSFQLHELQHTRPPCPSPTPGAGSNSCPSSRWRHPTISSSVIPISSHFQSFSASWCFPMSQFFASGGQSVGSFTFTISPSNEYSGLIYFRMNWLDLLEVKGTLKSLLQHHSSKASILRHSALFIVQLSHLYMTTGKTIALTRWTFVGKVMSLLFNMPSRLVIAFLPRS